MLEDKIAQLEHAKQCYLKDLEPEKLGYNQEKFRPASSVQA